MIKKFNYIHNKTAAVGGICLIIGLGVLIVRNRLIKPGNEGITKTPPFTYRSSELGFSFKYPETSVVANEEKNENSQSRRYLALVIKDSTLIKNNLKDDEQYAIVEVWRTDAPYVRQTCEAGSGDKKTLSAIKINGNPAVSVTYTDKFSRFHWDTCIPLKDKTVLIKASVSTKYGNKDLVSNYRETITGSFKFQ